jgi:hypothetical protein
MRNFLDPIELFDLVKSINARRKATMESEYLVLYYGCERKVVKKFSKELPDICVSVLPQAFIIKSVAEL